MIECDDVLIAVGQENAFPWIESDVGVAFGRNGLPDVDPVTFQSSLRQRLLRRRRRFRPEEHHHRGRARPRGRDLDRRLLPRRGPARCARDPMTNLVSQKMGIHEWSYDNDDHPRPPVPGAPCRERGGAEEHPDRSRARLRSRSRRSAKRSAASTATSRPCSPPRSASSATPASTSARSTASRSCPMRPRTSSAFADRARAQSFPGDLCLGAGQDPPGHGQGRGSLPALRALRRALPDRRLGHDEVHHRDGASRTLMPIQRRKRLRHSLRQRQRLGIGKRQSPVRAFDPAHGRADRAAQHLSLQHPGPADLVRSAGQRRRVARRARRRRHSRRDERADLRAGCRGARARRLPLLQFDPAAAALEHARRHRRSRHAADRNLRRPIFGPKAASALQEHRLCRRARRAPRYRSRGDGEAGRRTLQGQGQADRGQPAGAAHRL